ncbi:hypothetical protein C8R45DRAFT_1002945, partial [Mycena sanguinolenta]
MQRASRLRLGPRRCRSFLYLRFHFSETPDPSNSTYYEPTPNEEPTLKMTSIVVPAGTSYVAASLLSSVFLLTWQGIKVGGARKAANIAYPRLYAEKAEMDASPAALKFNCVQRAHANTLENVPSIYAIYAPSCISSIITDD